MHVRVFSACFVIIGSAYMIFSITRAGVLFKVLGRLCLRHRLANSCCVLNVCNSCCLRVLWVWTFAFDVNCQCYRYDGNRLCINL